MHIPHTCPDIDTTQKYLKNIGYCEPLLIKKIRKISDNLDYIFTEIKKYEDTRCIESPDMSYMYGDIQESIDLLDALESDIADTLNGWDNEIDRLEYLRDANTRLRTAAEDAADEARNDMNADMECMRNNYDDEIKALVETIDYLRNEIDELKEEINELRKSKD